MEYVVYTKRIAAELRKQGYKFIKTGVNENFPQFNTYIFEYEKGIEEALKTIAEQKK